MNERVIVGKSGGLDALQVTQTPEPVPQPGQVKVRILAAGVAYGDVMVRRGIGYRASAYPLTPGYDFAGVVEELGAGSTRYAVGDQVAGFPVLGGYQRFICLPEAELIPVPQGLLPADVVSVILNYTTAYQMLTRAANLQPGDTALMHGAAGGVGTAMLQLARLRGVKMYGTASTGKLEVVRRLGGLPIDYTRSDFVQELARLEPGGVNAVFDAVGGPQLNRSYRVLSKGGRLIFFGASSSVQGGGNPLLSLAGTIGRLALLTLRPGTRRVVPYLIGSAQKKRPEHFRQDVAALLALLQSGQIEPQIAQVLPLREVRQAHALLEVSGVTGKIVLQP